MPYDVAGNFTRNYNWVADRDAGIRILADRMDGEFNNYAGGLNQVFLRDGRVPLAGDLKLNGNAITGLGDGTSGSPSIRFGNDVNTGIYRVGDDILGFSAGGNKRLEAKGSGIQVFGSAVIDNGIQVAGGPNTFATVVVFNGGFNVVGGAAPNFNVPVNFNNGIDVDAGIVSHGNIVVDGGGTIHTGEEIKQIQADGSVGTEISGFGVALAVRAALTKNSIINFVETGFAHKWTIGTKAGDGSFYFWGSNDPSSTPLLTIGVNDGSLLSRGYIRSSGPDKGVGYATGAGGQVSQSGSRTNPVTLNRPCGKISTVSASLAAGAMFSFVFNNTCIGSIDMVLVCFQNAGGVDHNVWVSGISGNQCTINVRNISASSTSITLDIMFAIHKVVTS